jgi:23S rRNA pseudouridine1911/1915/1917 synthase
VDNRRRESPPTILLLMELGLQILDEEGPCLVACKPPGLPTQAPPGIDSLEVRIKAFLKQRDSPPHDVYLGVPHRLDRPASGAIVFATRRRAAHKLALQFEHREVKKLYWVCVAGRPDPPAGTWQDYLRKVYGKPQAEVVSADHPEAHLAVLHYRTLGFTPWGAWLEIELETGRTHQVRIQAASRAHPVLGDFQYGASVPFGPQHADERLRAIALHARTLEFQHPTTKQTISITAPPPEFWPAICDF